MFFCAGLPYIDWKEVYFRIPLENGEEHLFS